MTSLLLAFASAASLLLGAPAGAIPIPTRTTPLTLGFEWELNTEFCQDVGDGKVSMLQGVEKGDPWWTNHEDLGGLKWTPDHVHETSMLQTIELITGPLTREQIMPMVNAMKADAASLEEPNLSDPETKVHQFTQKTVEVYKPKDDHKIQNCPTDAWFTSVPRNVPSQHCTFPMKFGHFHRAGTPHNVFLDAAKSVATELGHPENPQLLDALFLFVSLAAHKGDHRKLGLAPRVNPSDLAHLIDSDDVRQAIFQARTTYAGTPKPEGDPKEHDESDLIQRMKHNWNREDRFGVNSDFDPDSSTSIAQCARPRVSDVVCFCVCVSCSRLFAPPPLPCHYPFPISYVTSLSEMKMGNQYHRGRHLHTKSPFRIKVKSTSWWKIVCSNWLKNTTTHALKKVLRKFSVETTLWSPKDLGKKTTELQVICEPTCSLVLLPEEQKNRE
jgi:hypothetical protein